MLEKNSLFTGLVVGAIVPVLGYLLFEFIIEMLNQLGVMSYFTGRALIVRTRTIALLGICSNLIPFNVCRKYKWDDTMRGVVFPTLLYVGFWLYQYGGMLLNSL